MPLQQLHHHKRPWSGHAHNRLSYYSFLTCCFLLSQTGVKVTPPPSYTSFTVWGGTPLERGLWCRAAVRSSSISRLVTVGRLHLMALRLPMKQHSILACCSIGHIWWSHHLHHVHQYHHWLHHPTNLLYFSGVTPPY